MPRRNAISSNIYSPNKATHLEPTISSQLKQREKYVNEAIELAKIYLDIFRVDSCKIHPINI